MNAPGVYLSQYLSALSTYLERSDVTDIYINKPNALWVETLNGAIECHTIPDLDTITLERLAKQIAAFSSQGINREHPLLSASLPDGARIQIALPPATRGEIAMAIRKHVVADMTIDQIATNDGFSSISETGRHDDIQDELLQFQQKKDFAGLLKKAVGARQNILISGGTSTGKTTFLNALLKEIDPKERLILIEDTPELSISHENAVGLIAKRSPLGESVVSMEDLLNASLRMRPDRIILGELRGPEAFTFLRAINTGHPGSMTTIHAGSPDRAIEQLVLLVLQSGTNLDRASIIHYIRSSIDIYVQLGRKDGKRIVTHIDLKK